MKFITSFAFAIITFFFSHSIQETVAADLAWLCPPNNCKRNFNPYGYVRGKDIHFCYNPTTGLATCGILAGCTVPEGWIDEPCTAEEYSECNTDADCSLESSFSDGSCDCYASSYYHPFNPCGDDECPMCDEEGACEDKVATCIIGTEGSGGMCTLKNADSSDNADISKALQQTTWRML